MCLWGGLGGFDWVFGWFIFGVGLGVIEHWILDENKNLVEVDLLTWGEWFEDIENRRVASTHIGLYHVSTVFLGINHSWTDKGAPLVYETMVFCAKGNDTYMTRHHTWLEAEIGHMNACEWVKNGAKEN